MKSKMDEKKACGLHCTKINNISVKFGNDVILKNVIIIKKQDMMFLLIQKQIK